MPGFIIVSDVIHWFSCLPATEFDWIASLVSLVSLLELNSTFLPIQLSSYDHTLSYLRFNMQECLHWWLILYVYVAVYFGSMTLVLCCCVSIRYITDSVSCLLSTSPFFFSSALCPALPPYPPPPPPPTPPSCSFCTCLSRCKQVHAPLIPAPAGPTQCGAVWGNGGHGTRRGFWIQSIQKRPGSFLAEF